MKSYLKNIYSAIIGRYPDREELDNMNAKLQELSQTVLQFQDLYYKCWQSRAEIEKTVSTLQELVENMRDRLAEKEILIGTMKKEHERQIEQYTKEINSLKNK